jgi:hypothetical protein
VAVTSKQVEEAVKSGKLTIPRPGPNVGKRVRKAYRKGLRNEFSNARHNRAIKKMQRQEFYRKLRVVKLRRHEVLGAVEAAFASALTANRAAHKAYEVERAVNPALLSAALGASADLLRQLDEARGHAREFAYRSVRRDVHFYLKWKVAA